MIPTRRNRARPWPVRVEAEQLPGSGAGLLPEVVLRAVGADESDEFRRQTALIAQAWGSESVVASETVAGRNHMNVLHELADPLARTHRLGLGLLGLVSIGTD